MTDAEAQRNALIIASDCIDVESSTQLEVRHRGLPAEERHQIEAHLEQISMELYERSGALGWGPVTMSSAKEGEPEARGRA